MADYYNLQQLSQRTKISESEIRQLQEAGFLSPVAKNGHLFYSSQQAYRLQTAVRWARKDHLALKDAFSKVEEKWLATKQEQPSH
jgi:DNA-binding transcriptional MerR regulator